MFKLLLIIAISVYLLSKIGRFLFRFNPSRTQQENRNTNSNVNDGSTKNKKGGSVKGGEYVDFEEIK